jgi:hypothetical protein
MTYEQIREKIGMLMRRALDECDGAFGKTTLILDFATYRTIVQSDAVDIDKATRQLSWIGLKLHVVHPPVKALGPDTASSNTPMTVEVEPFCMSLDVVKDNGRHAYYDDPDTDPRYL